MASTSAAAASLRSKGLGSSGLGSSGLGSSGPLGPAEFAASFEQSSRLLWTLAAGVLGARAEVGDVLQEACVIALSKLDTFERGTSFAAWMGQVVRFVALNHARAHRQSSSTDPDELDRVWSSPPNDPPPDFGARGELAAGAEPFEDDVERALRTLSPVARTCVLLRTVQELDYAEIAGVLGIPQGTAMSHVHRSRAALRALLAHRGPRENGGTA
jgi:RNA polymerase sigma-70 factor (ECF subfamily)